MTELITPVLTIVLGWLVRSALRWLKVEIDEKVFNAIVAALVVNLLAALGISAGARAGLW